MPQARKVRPRSHGDDHLVPSVGDEMGGWRPEEFRRARELLADCEQCQACLFDTEGEGIGHLNEGVVAAIAQERIQGKLGLVDRHLRTCAECTQALAEAEENHSEEFDDRVLLDGEFDSPDDEMEE